MHVYWYISRLCFWCKKSGGTHEHYAALLCNCVRGVNGRTKVKLALQNSTAVTWWHGFVKHMFTYHLDCVSLHTSYCYRTEDIPAVQEEVGRSTLRATVLNMTKIIGESDTSISRLQWEKKKQKLLSQTQNRSHADSVPGEAAKQWQVLLKCTCIPLRCTTKK